MLLYQKSGLLIQWFNEKLWTEAGGPYRPAKSRNSSCSIIGNVVLEEEQKPLQRLRKLLIIFLMSDNAGLIPKRSQDNDRIQT